LNRRSVDHARILLNAERASRDDAGTAMDFEARAAPRSVETCKIGLLRKGKAQHAEPLAEWRFGIVIDAAVANAQVRIFESAGNLVGSELSNGQGQYEFDDLPGGAYRLEFSNPGFQRSIIDGLSLDGGGELTQNVTMQIGSVSETVQVSATMQNAQTETAVPGQLPPPGVEVGSGGEVGASGGVWSGSGGGVGGGVLVNRDTVFQLVLEQVSQFLALRCGGYFAHHLKNGRSHCNRKIVAQKAVVAALDAELAKRASDRQQIFDDQQRIRENLKALKGTAEERALTERYTKELSDQQTQLETLQRESADLQ
jgi:Carboxypeptidase regulatory-like domain